MSSSFLPFLQVQLTRFGLTTLLILGDIGTVLVVLLFSKQRKNACSMYLLNGAIMNNFLSRIQRSYFRLQFLLRRSNLALTRFL
jgi:hypothetical protein